MYVCPNCGGNLRFDIPSQNLACDHCDSHFDPYAVEKEKDVSEQSSFDANVFVCPQCGGEIMSTENSVAEFCPYCGSSSILSPRLTQARRPDYIIPFKITKEQCKKNYNRFLATSLFAPNAYRKAGKIDSFRGIYIPYLSYNISQEKSLELKAEKTYRRGDYRITDHYRLGGELQAYYNGLSYDAASSFDDSLSGAIAPFNVKEKMPFSPAYLSGFYADNGDVPQDLYLPEAEKFANEATMNQLTHVEEFRSAGAIDWPASDNSLNSNLGTYSKSVDSAMYPVWFMSYRNKDRIAYAVVNGQTGKTTADLPVSIPKYLLGALVVAIPLFLLIAFVFPSIVPKVTIIIACILSLVMNLIYNSELNAILKKESHQDDKGYMAKHANGRNVTAKVTATRPKPRKTASSIAGIVIAVITASIIILSLGEELMDALQDSSCVLVPACAIVSLISMIYSMKKYKQQTVRKGIPVSVLNFVGICISLIVTFISPVSDIPYYVAALLLLAITFLTAITVIERYNILATRRLPQFDKKGGDDRA